MNQAAVRQGEVASHHRCDWARRAGMRSARHPVPGAL